MTGLLSQKSSEKKAIFLHDSGRVPRPPWDFSSPARINSSHSFLQVGLWERPQAPKIEETSDDKWCTSVSARVKPSHGRVGVVQHQSLRSLHEELNIFTRKMTPKEGVRSHNPTKLSTRQVLKTTYLVCTREIT